MILVLYASLGRSITYLSTYPQYLLILLYSLIKKGLLLCITPESCGTQFAFRETVRPLEIGAKET